MSHSVLFHPTRGVAASGRRSSERPAAGDIAESVSPNPASDVLTVTHPSETFEMILTDMLGKEVRHQTGSGHQHSLNVADLPGGLYILQIRTGDLIQSQHRVVVAH